METFTPLQKAQAREHTCRQKKKKNIHQPKFKNNTANEAISHQEQLAKLM